MVSAYRTLLFSVLLLVVITYETQANNAVVGETCTIDRNCISNQMTCQSNTCNCFRGHIPSEDRRSCAATTRGLCFEDADCRSLQFSSCFTLEGTEGACMCNEGYTSSRDDRRCLPVSNFQGPCEEPGQCTPRMGMLAVCLEGRCDCQPLTHFLRQEGRCIQSVGLGGACVNASQCVTGSSVCDGGMCACSRGFVQDQDRCRAGAQSVVVSGAAFLLYWIIKFVIS